MLASLLISEARTCICVDRLLSLSHELHMERAVLYVIMFTTETNLFGLEGTRLDT